jgi:hypothetical protein
LAIMDRDPTPQVPTIGAPAVAAAAAAAKPARAPPKPKANAAPKPKPVRVSKRKSTSIQRAAPEPDEDPLKPHADGARSIGPADIHDMPDIAPPVKRVRRKPNNTSPAATAAAIGSDPKKEFVTKPTAKQTVEKSKRVPSAAPQGNRKPVVRKVSIAPSTKVAGGLAAKGARKPRNKKALLTEVERLKGP